MYRPYENLFPGFYETTKGFYRYIILTSQFDEGNIVAHRFPLRGKEPSIEHLVDFLELKNVDKDQIVFSFILEGKAFVPLLNSTWDTSGIELVGKEGDILNNREDLQGTGSISYSEVRFLSSRVVINKVNFKGNRSIPLKLNFRYVNMHFPKILSGHLRMTEP